ncbi:MAG TPA: 30S ribosomal protein S15 [Elusimicrobia bacterium]|nr:MAG: 30S ribosomal protein S15 [Elusimicrobia bacterium RIFOXYA12_FULL_49_49]OGS08181.1 MAG: 30S ribosomal protein S15 [Elusimicrobia bacterium RIFOXYA1_FULL_47_7]OGS11249.1 MAG: 30S ribosomal protein S15 [Elusimicrobia bacterium RIFOXYB1_FULL_48_9]OGS15646.1 MAG: 30S ribosomal protein S15 [Elusimicrobia bacterium RIFOXYA2_FULL_47_53]OGS26798.1 MAG: 30S ribosomal protein S15 [Elusimicrobia bacterium RIFOXYB12_FULL_50_12]OGS30745.1 MAG: 30S ribosomal protein S15 [Elusimicrobia bacterium RIFO
MVTQKKEIIEKYKTHPTDTGSPEVQVALLTTKINHLGDHFKKFPKDFTSRSGFLKMISQRRRLLDYLKKHSVDEYKKIIAKLDLRK